MTAQESLAIQALTQLVETIDRKNDEIHADPQSPVESSATSRLG